jgi:hypothetical protein
VTVDVSVTYHAPASGASPTQSPLFNVDISMFGSAGQERRNYECGVVVPNSLDTFAELIDGGTAMGSLCFLIDEAEAAGPLLVRVEESLCFANCDQAWTKVQ